MKGNILRSFGLAAAFICLVIIAFWGTLAIYFSNLPSALRPIASGIFALVAVSLILSGLRKRKRRAWGAFLVVFAVVILAWWLLIPPSNNRDWQPDLAILSWADIAGDKVTIHNIRNCDYRTETDFTVRHYDKTFDLSRLKGADFFLVYWGSPKIAHTMMSFDFEGQGNVCFSIETRKEKGEAYSTVKGFFRQYELIYVVADERDLVRLRTNYREKGKGEDVYLYRLNATPEVARKVFLSYLREVNRLKERPQWYNALTENCTTSIRQHTMPYNPNARLDWRMIVNGYIDEMLYERKAIDTSLSFAELKKRSYINPKAKAADNNPAFSRLIRVGLPGTELKP
ncbi:MAG: DUF4105 domain-containing protein [Desulfuromonadales bacterium]|nr:MAG: DUF4105 domain-containing protein [Desulfuromonadales bacterium]